MNDKLYIVHYTTMHNKTTGGGHYVVWARTANEARMCTIEFLETLYKLAPAHWETGKCGHWVRTWLCNEDPLIRETDGFKAAVSRPLLSLTRRSV